MKQITNKKQQKIIVVKAPSKSQFAGNRADKKKLEQYYSRFMGEKAAFIAAGVTQTPTSLMSGLSLGKQIITGQGDYSISGSGGVPSFRKAESAVITHREYITDIKSGPLVGGSSAFTIEKYPINPGVSTTFPWMANIAANYEEYEIIGMVFNFIATSGESVASTNTALGTVILATEYDPTKPDFVNKQAMENYSFSSSAKPSHSQIHAIECKKSLSPVKQLYVRSGTITGSDIRWSDFGNFFIATVGCPAAGTNLGELWVSYKIRLHKPRLPITVGLGGQIATGYTNRSGVITGANGGTTTLSSRGSIPLTVTAAGTLRFPGIPNMNYLVTFCIRATTSATGLFSFTGFTNAAALNVYDNYTNALQGSATGGSTVSNLMVTCTSTDTNDLIGFDFGASTIVGTAVIEITVTQVDETFSI